EEVLRNALEKTDIVLLTGGLGPTQDDMTKVIVAKVFDTKLCLDESCLEEIRSYFEARNRVMSENNIQQAMLPEGAVIFHNQAGTAPSFAIEKDGKCAVCFPGPPREMKWIFRHGVSDYLSKFIDQKIYYRIIRTIGIGESDLEMKLMPLIDGQTDPTIATYAKEAECSFRIASRRDTLEEARNAVNEMLEKVFPLVGEYIYSCDDEELNEVVVRKLKERGLTLSSAESCTAGLFAASITDVPGASKVYTRGYVTYDAAAKISMVGVRPETIGKYSVVSRETAREMAVGAMTQAGADLAVSVTGYAGPEADEGRSVGEAWIGYAYRDVSGAVQILTGWNDRRWNRNFFRLRMLRAVNEILDREF
ncbi:MAG: CinA family nicotinamide mononucleotide deamidase-related protein, partial [Mogibacterium sp.]|nr:CinA family nicotinamide mononucleotide deamidase-related protein [Mogibacterium sp.]